MPIPNTRPIAYTPAKAISLMIAAQAFHQLPLRKNYGIYPADSVFGAFRVSYKESLSEVNTAQAFYYSNTTRTRPVNAARLRHVAGVGSSPVVQYSGTGAYFLDKLDKGVWRLEVMPDANNIRDPFAKPSPGKEVTRIQWQIQDMKINLSDLGNTFFIRAVNEGNKYTAGAQNGGFQVQPGTYLLSRKERTSWNGNSPMGTIAVKEFVAPPPFDTKPFVSHQPYPEISAGKPFIIQAKVVGIKANAKVSLQLNNLAGIYKSIGMEKVGPYQYQTEVPAELASPGQVNYQIMVQDGEQHFTFPGGYEGDPWAWDYYQNESWHTWVAAPQGSLELFNATTDRNIFVFPNLWKSDERQLMPDNRSNQLILKLTAKELPTEQIMGFQQFIADKLKGRASELTDFDNLVVRIRTANVVPVQVKVSLITENAAAFGALLQGDKSFKDIKIPLYSLKPEPYMLLPRPYPGFQPFWFNPSGVGTFSLRETDKLQIALDKKTNPSVPNLNNSFEVEAVWLEKD